MSIKEIIEALTLCDDCETGVNCHICPMRDKDFEFAWDNPEDDTDCRKELKKLAIKALKDTPDCYTCKNQGKGYICRECDSSCYEPKE